MTLHKLADPYCNFQYQEVIVLLYVGPPLFILTCIGFNVIKTSKEKQKVILQFRPKVYMLTADLRNKRKCVFIILTPGQLRNPEVISYEPV